MNLARVFWRIALLSAVAAVFVWLTAMYGYSAPLPKHPEWSAWRAHRNSAPQFRQFPEFAGELILLAVYSVAGRVVFRLRLTPSSAPGQPLSLGLHRQPGARQVPTHS
jgi:hypothetical protein